TSLFRQYQSRMALNKKNTPIKIRSPKKIPIMTSVSSDVCAKRNVGRDRRRGSIDFFMITFSLTNIALIIGLHMHRAIMSALYYILLLFKLIILDIVNYLSI